MHWEAFALRFDWDYNSTTTQTGRYIYIQYIYIGIYKDCLKRQCHLAFYGASIVSANVQHLDQQNHLASGTEASRASL